MKTSPHVSGLQRYLDIEGQLLAHRAKRWFQGLPPDKEAEARFFDELEAASEALTPEETAALREIAIARAIIRPRTTVVDVAAPRRTGQGPRRFARVGGLLLVDPTTEAEGLRWPDADATSDAARKPTRRRRPAP